MSATNVSKEIVQEERPPAVIPTQLELVKAMLDDTQRQINEATETVTAALEKFRNQSIALQAQKALVQAIKTAVIKIEETK